MESSNIKRYGGGKQLCEVPCLTETQQKFYAKFTQEDVLPDERKDDGLESLFSEAFPIPDYNGVVSLEYLGYDLGEPRHSPQECRDLGLSYAMPLRVKLRVKGAINPVEEDVYLGEIPRMMAGGEFLINGAERVIVTQIQRSPGVDFFDERHVSGKTLFNCRIIPERGSWITVETTAKELLAVQIDRSTGIPATTFLRALEPALSTDADILRLFHPEEVKIVKLSGKGARDVLRDSYLVLDVIDPNTGEILLPALTQIIDETFDMMRTNGVDEVEALVGVKDPIVINTIREEAGVGVHSHEEALVEIFKKLRPGNPPTQNKAQELMQERFRDPLRYNLGPIGRFRMDRKFNLGERTDASRVLLGEDMYRIMQYLICLRRNEGNIDDIDDLQNRRIRTIKDLVMDEFRRGLVKMRRSIREKMSNKSIDEINPRGLINSQTVASAVDYFFARSELSQVVDQPNPLSMLTHERRLSALGPGGLNRKRAGFEVRDVHPSHYGRICPIETPEGANIGLIVSLSIFSSVNDMGFLVTPYIKVVKGKITDEIVTIRADQEKSYKIAQGSAERKGNGFANDVVMCRFNGDPIMLPVSDVELIDVAPHQMVGVAASLIPFLEHDDAPRTLMGSNMQRQAVPLLIEELPLVGTGMEKAVAENSGMVVTSPVDGTIVYADATRIEVEGQDSKRYSFTLRKFTGLNERTCMNQKPMVRVGDAVVKGQTMTEGTATLQGELALGKNVKVAFVSWEGANFEDAILVSEKLLKEDTFTSIHIETFTLEVRETKLGKEEITRDIPNVPEASLRNLDDNGLVQVGTFVAPGDILVGKISPKSKVEYSSEEKLLHAIFGRVGEDVKNDSLEVRPGVSGCVINVKHFKRQGARSSEQRRAMHKELREKKELYQQRAAEIVKRKFAYLESKECVGGKLEDAETKEKYSLKDSMDEIDIITMNDALRVERLGLSPKRLRKTRLALMEIERERRILDVAFEQEEGKIRRGHELSGGVLEMVKVHIAVKRRLSIGDKFAGRHGNKGVISRILPEEDMPFMEDGSSIDLILNPLGVPSRMNLGQILEVHLAMAMKKLGMRAITPVFNGATEEEIKEELIKAGLNIDGKAKLYDGRTGEPFDQRVTVGYMYIIKLTHLVADKIHARATGPYSLITQQPLGGKARSGGQRFGEMEVWALEAYGAANILQELLTVKSDDVDGRAKIYESMVKGDCELNSSTPVSFNVLMNEIKGLGFNMRLERAADSPSI